MKNQHLKITCGSPLARCLEEIEAFHGFKSPGMVLGLFMVHRAQDRMGPGVEADAIVETRHCLPDAVQLFTPCTVGNGWLKILDWDKYALTLYDRHTLDGWRVWFDLEKARTFPALYQWFMRLVPKKDLPLETLLDTVLAAGEEVLSERAIRVTDFYQRQKKANINLCPDCGEAFTAAQGDRCLACQGSGYYRFRSDLSPRSGLPPLIF